MDLLTVLDVSLAVQEHIRTDQIALFVLKIRMDVGISIPVYHVWSATQMQFRRAIALQELVQLTPFNAPAALVLMETGSSAPS